MSSLPRLRVSDFASDPDTQIAIHREHCQQETKPHRHDFVELVIVFSGTATHHTEGFSHQIGRGHVLVINRSRSHRFSETRELNLVNILIREDLILEAGRDLATLPGFHVLFTLEPVKWKGSDYREFFNLDEAALPEFGERLGYLEEELQRGDAGCRLMARSWLFLILGELSRLHSAGFGADQPITNRLSQVLSWMERNYTRTLTLGEIATVARMSERSFLRHFREALGSSPIEYLNKLRIRRARELLKTRSSGLTIAEVGHRSGFEDSNYFARVFRRHLGCSPREFSRSTREVSKLSR